LEAYRGPCVASTAQYRKKGSPADVWFSMKVRASYMYRETVKHVLSKLSA